MQRQSLQNYPIASIILITFFVVFTALIPFLNNEKYTTDFLVLISIVTAIGFLLVVFALKSKKIEFDEEYLYITHKKSQTKILLDDIYEIRYSPLSYAKGTNILLKILYHSNEKTENKVSVSISKYIGLDKTFIKNVTTKNPNLKIHTFYIWFLEN